MTQDKDWPTSEERPWTSPGPAPWIPAPAPRRPAWPTVVLVLGVLLICCAGTVLMGLISRSGPVTVVPAPDASLQPVGLTGTCQKQVIGEYGLIATVTATNTTGVPQAGTIWVRWPMTGSAAREFTKPVTLAPGEVMEFPVSQPVSAEEWTRAGACSFGWTSD